MEVQSRPHAARRELQEELKTASSAAVLSTGDELLLVLVLVLVPVPVLHTFSASQLTRPVAHLQDSRAAKCKQGFKITR